MDDYEALTSREQEILLLIADGLSNQAIADRLFLTVGTVKWYNRHLYAKLRTTSRTQTIAQARELGLLGENKKIASHNLPSPTTPFIGREIELADLQKKLLYPSTRLLTLFGPGGIGKTRLAIQLAAQCIDSFGDGVYLCQLQGVVGSDSLLTEIANSVGFSISGQQKRKTQLLNYLQNKSMLLVIDNFEHLLDSGSLLSEMLEASPRLKLLVTSRERLNLRSEWLYSVLGLPFPVTPRMATVNSYPAIELFAIRAQQVMPTFTLQTTLEHVVRICQFVEGMPLAIELAASWLRVLDVSEIAERIESNLELDTNQRDVPARHRSMRAVFDTSWHMLTPAQQAVFQTLAVFQGGFSLDAVQAITQVSLSMLAEFVDKALLYRVADGRFNLHELVRQYAEAHLHAHATDHQRIFEAYSTYYADFLHERTAQVRAEQQWEANAQIRADIQNIRSAWRWAVQNRRADLLEKSAFSLFQYFRFNSLYLEADETFRAAAESLADLPIPDSGRVLAEILCYRGWTRVRSGDTETAEKLFEGSLAIYNTLEIDPIPGVATDPLTGFGIIACVHGRYDEAVRLGHQALALSEKRDDPWNQVQANYILVSATFALGDFSHARIYVQRAHDILDERHERWMITYMKNLLGNIARACGELDQATGYFQESFRIYQQLDDREGVARTLNQMGQVALLQQDYQQAQELHLQSYRSYLELGDQGGLATALYGLGLAANALGEPEAAHKTLSQALDIAGKIPYLSLVCSILVGIGEVFIGVGQLEAGVSLLGFVESQPACQMESRERIAVILDQILLTSNPVLEAYNQGREMEYETAVQLALSKVHPPT